jgi:putative ABC transport system permease protein
MAALPTLVIAWYMIDQWLQNFAYRTEINYGLFCAVLLFTLLLTFLTTGFHALKAIKLNPAQNLKNV